VEIARRLYLYFVLAVSLIALAIGLVNLLEIAFVAIDGAFQDGLLVGEDAELYREQLSLNLALTLVALPIWLIHWWLIERALRDVAAADERASAIRAFYIAGGMLVPLLWWLPSALDLVQRVLEVLLSVNESDATAGSVANDLATALVLTLLWLFHRWLYRRDRQESLPERALWPGRLYLYGAAITGLGLVLIGAVSLCELIVETIFDEDALLSSDWWRVDLANGIALLVVGGVVWGGHWWYGLRVVTGESWQAAGERRSVLRRIYLYLGVLIGAIGALVTLVIALRQPLLALFGVDDSAGFDTSTRQRWHDFIQPLVIAVPFGLVWLFHRWQLIAEAEHFAEGEQQVAVRRTYTYLVAFIGLAFAAGGAAYLIGVLIDLLLDGGRAISVEDDWWKRQVAQFVPIVLAGAAVWLWHWNRVQQWVRAAPEVERQALPRRVYMYLTLAAAMVALLVGVAILLYRLLTVVLGATSFSSETSSFSSATGVALIAALVIAFHLRELLTDLRARAGTRAATRRLPLTLIAPAGADLETTLDALRSHLPEGFRLESRAEDDGS
jgi:hypothetical protein